MPDSMVHELTRGGTPHVPAGTGAHNTRRLRRILFLSPIPPPAGGIATWTRILLERGLPDGYTVGIVNTAVGSDRNVFARGTVLAEARRLLHIVFRTLGELVFRRPYMLHVNNAIGSLGLLRDGLCVLMSRIVRVPVVIHYRGLAVIPAERRAYIASLRRVARMAALNIVLNEPSAEFLRRLLNGRSAVEKLPNFFDQRQVPRVRPEIRHVARRRAIFVAGLIVSKGVCEMVSLARRLGGVDFHLFGKRYPESDAWFDGAPVNLIIHDELPHEIVIHEMRASDVLVFPTRHPEGFPNVVCEAMAVGLPIVSTAVGAIPEMVEDGRGGRISAIDLDSLEEAVCDVLSDETRRLAMGLYNQEKAYRMYEYADVIERLVSLYERVQKPRDRALSTSS